ncbi:hypothetical protein Taro_030680 [Colocasia esculenta]|uniref:Auxin-responsive protein n=1 Tax=Colocasia esculenta TaxID=4460 RepID=A0A843VGX7_COLES|nr:hypothetical protein [Colocasia esculenta]
MAMELELGLALPSVNFPSKGLGLDLNGEASPMIAAVPKKKRSVADAFAGDNTTDTATLPLFVWDFADDGNNNKSAYSCSLEAFCDLLISDDDNGGSRSTAPVGWPPVKPARLKAAGGTRYVKVKMEGVAIGRKVDLSLHRSYATLLDAVDRLFTRNHHVEAAGDLTLGEDGASLPTSHFRTFTYQDVDGDWMLLGDVPWETFVKSAKRLKIHSSKE